MFFSLFGEIYVRQGEVNYNLFTKFIMRHEGFSFYGLRESDEGADADLIYMYNCRWRYQCEDYILIKYRFYAELPRLNISN